jgi:hypothetical protein
MEYNHNLVVQAEREDIRIKLHIFDSNVKSVLFYGIVCHQSHHFEVANVSQEMSTLNLPHQMAQL